MKPSLVIPSVETLIRAQIPALLLGQPGVGKTALIHQLAAKLGWRCLTSRLSLREPVDLRGLPTTDEQTGTTRWLVPDEFPKAGDPPTIWFFDEWAQAAPAVQNAAGQILHEGGIGEWRKPDNVYVCAASNRQKDRAATNRMPSHIRDRFDEINVDVDVDDWCKHMLKVGAAIETVAFVRFRPEFLTAWDNPEVLEPKQEPGKPKLPATSSEEKVPTPRGFEKVAQITKAAPPAEVEFDLYRGQIGMAAAAEYTGFLRVFRQMPSVDAVLMNPATAPIPSEPSALYALTTALAKRANSGNFDRVVSYLDRIPADFQVAGMKRTVDADPSLQNTRAFIQWAAENSSAML